MPSGDSKALADAGSVAAPVSRGRLPRNPEDLPLPRFVTEAAVEIPALSEEEGEAEEEPIAAVDAGEEMLDLLSPITEIVAPDALKGHNAVPDFVTGDTLVMDEYDDQAEAAK